MGMTGRGRGRRCSWVRVRLPLLTGGELTGLDRREVERHLTGCDGCRREASSLAGALGALRLAALRPPGGPEAPSLWPALARQIRESRHEPRPSVWASVRPALILTPAALAAGFLAAVLDLPSLWRAGPDPASNPEPARAST